MSAFHLLTSQDPRDEASFGAGYSAASNRSLIRDALAFPGVTPVTLCGALFDSDTARDGIVRGDFVDGCTRAVGDVME